MARAWKRPRPHAARAVALAALALLLPGAATAAPNGKAKLKWKVEAPLAGERLALAATTAPDGSIYAIGGEQ